MSAGFDEGVMQPQRGILDDVGNIIHLLAESRFCIT